MNSSKLTKMATLGATALMIGLGVSSYSALAEGMRSAAEQSPDVYRVLAENDRIRVIEAHWKPGQRDKFHSHPANRAVYYPTNCKLRIFKPDGSHREGSPKAGKARVIEGKPVKKHSAQNVGNTDCRVILIEMKK